MLKVFVLQNQSVSSQYGIGNYIHILREYYIKLNYKLFFINLFVIDKKEVCVKKNLDSFMEIYIPYNSSHRATFHDNDYSKVSKYICYILKQYITSSDKVIFHLNSSSNFGLANSLKRYFPKSRTLLTIHYTNWAFILKGNTQWLNEIIRKKHTIDPIETKVIDSVKADINTFNCCDKIICIAEHSYDFLRKTCAINEDKIVLINNAIHDTYKQDNCQLKKNLRTKFFIPEKVDILLYVGRIDDNKGLSFLLQ